MVQVITVVLSYFNSRPHGGRHLSDLLKNKKFISTHALTEGD